MYKRLSLSLLPPLHAPSYVHTPYTHQYVSDHMCICPCTHTHTHTSMIKRLRGSSERGAVLINQSEVFCLGRSQYIYIYIYIYILGRRAAPGALELRGALEGCRGATRGAPTGTPTPTEGAGNLTPTEGAGNPRRYRGATEDYEEPQSAARSHSGSALIEST